MNKIKKLSIVLVALAMCMMLGVTVWAAGDPYSIALDNTALCYSEDGQRVTVTITTNEEITVGSLYAEIIMPQGWSINTIINETLGIDEGNYTTTDDGKENHYVVWVPLPDKDENITEVKIPAGGTLLTIVYDVRAKATVDTYDIGVKDLELSNNYGTNVFAKNVSLSTKVTIQEHVSNEITYVDNADGTHTVKHTCCGATEEPVPHTYDQKDGTECVCGKKKGLKGDLNSDGKVDSNDATALARHLARMPEYILTDSVAMANADTNRDGKIDSNDGTMLARYLAKMIEDKDWFVD